MVIGDTSISDTSLADSSGNPPVVEGEGAGILRRLTRRLISRVLKRCLR